MWTATGEDKVRMEPPQVWVFGGLLTLLVERRETMVAKAHHLMQSAPLYEGMAMEQRIESIAVCISDKGGLRRLPSYIRKD